MTSAKKLAPELRLVELALANGWSREDVAGAFEIIVGPVAPSALETAAPSEFGNATPLPSSGPVEASSVLRDEFARLSRKRTR